MADNINLNIDTEKFIREIKKRPTLWDPSCSDYGKIEKKRQCWTEVLEIFKNEEYGVNEQNHFGYLLQKKWKNLRGSFTRELSRQDEPDPKRKNVYHYYENLLFLKNVVTTTKGSENSESVSNYANSMLKTGEPSTKQRNVKKSTAPSTSSKKKGIKGSGVDQDLLNVLNQSVQLREERERNLEQDSERMFLMSTVSLLKMVPEDKKLDVKIEIMDAIKRAIPPKSTSRQIEIDINPLEIPRKRLKHDTSETDQQPMVNFINLFSVKAEPELIIENSSNSSEAESL